MLGEEGEERCRWQRDPGVGGKSRKDVLRGTLVLGRREVLLGLRAGGHKGCGRGGSV